MQQIGADGGWGLLNQVHLARWPSWPGLLPNPACLPAYLADIRCIRGGEEGVRLCDESIHIGAALAQHGSVVGVGSQAAQSVRQHFLHRWGRVSGWVHTWTGERDGKCAVGKVGGALLQCNSPHHKAAAGEEVQAGWAAQPAGPRTPLPAGLAWAGPATLNPPQKARPPAGPGWWAPPCAACAPGWSSGPGPPAAVGWQL